MRKTHIYAELDYWDRGKVSTRGRSPCDHQRTMLKTGFKRRILAFLNLWPPLLGAGIRVTRISPDWREIDVEMKLRWWNRNYVRTHYGGSLYSVADPFYMLMLLENLGSEYIVWDKAATIRFRKPGRGTVSAGFRLTQDQIDEIKRAVSLDGKIERTFKVEIKDASGTLIAEVDKLLHIRNKKRE